MGFYKGNGLPPATEYSSGDEYLDLTTGKTYLNEGGSWKLISSKSSGVAFASLDSNGQVIERLSYEGVAGGVATLDSNGQVIERLSYEGAAGGVATLDTNGQVVEPPSGASITSLPKTSLTAGDIIPVVQGGVSKTAPAGQAGGLATLDASGKLVQPRRVLQVIGQQGSTASPSTTAPLLNYILPDPRITMTTLSNGKLVVFGTIRVRGDTSYYNGAAAVLVISADGGTTWTEIGGRRGAHTHSDFSHSTIPLLATHSVIAGTTYTIGIAIGANAGTVYADNINRNIVVMEVDY